MILLGISRKLFTHSLPLIVAEQCYEKLLKDARNLVQDTKIAAKGKNIFNVNKFNRRLQYQIVINKSILGINKTKRRIQKFWNKYKEISKLKERDFIEYIKQKEILFIKDDLKIIQRKN